MRGEYFRPGSILRGLLAEATPFFWVRLVAVVMCVISGSALTALGPAVLRDIIDAFAPGGRVASRGTGTLAAIYVLTLALARVANEARGMAFAQMEQRMYTLLTERVFAHLMGLPLRFHLERKTGAVGQALTSGLEGFRGILRHLAFNIAPVLVELATMLVVLSELVSASFIGIFCAAAICYCVGFCYSAAGITKSARKGAAARVEAMAEMTDGLLNYETVKCFTGESFIQGRVASALGRAEGEWLGYYRRCAANGLVAAGAFTCLFAGTIIYGIQQMKEGVMTLGEFVLINAYMIQIIRPIERAGLAVQGIWQGAAMLEKLMLLLREAKEDEGRGSVDGRAVSGSLQFRDVSVSYCGRRVVDGLNIRVAPGQTLGIVGASGSGKSTIVRLLTRLLEPEGGVILIGGVPINEVPLRKLRRSVAVVPQDSLLFDMSIRDNIAFGRPSAAPEEVERAARIARLHEFIITLPDGYDTLVGERGIKLSGGERQRVSIARAILRTAMIYVFDEATSSLDSRLEQEILGGLQLIAASRTTLIIAHRLATVAKADEIVLLDCGEIVERGTHQGLLRRNGRYAELWRLQEGRVAEW